MRSRIRVFFLPLLVATFLSSCDVKQSLTYHTFNDKIISYSFNLKSGSCQGIQAIYLVYGKLPNGMKEGEAISPFWGKAYYRIKDLLDRNRKLRTLSALQAEDRQEKDGKLFINP
jgi:hypothetical protein